MISLALAFIIELVALVSYGYLGTMLFSTVSLKIVAAVGCIGIMAFLWGSFFSPKADHRLVMPDIFVGKLTLLLMPSYIFYIKRTLCGQVYGQL